MAFATNLIDWLQRRYLKKVDRYLAHADGVYRLKQCAERGTSHSQSQRQIAQRTTRWA